MQSRIGVVIQGREGSAAGMQHCFRLAQRLGCSVHVMDVTESTPRWMLRSRGVSGGEEQRIAERRMLLERFVSNIRSGDVAVSVAARRGRRIVELIKEVHDTSVDLLVLVADDARISSTVAEAFNSRVVRKSPVPVLVLRPAVPDSSGTVVALDISLGDDSDALISSIIGRAVEVTPDDSRITFVHVLELPGSTMAKPEIDDLAQRVIEERRKRLERLAIATRRPDTVRVEVRVGQPVEEIAAVVHEQQADLLVVGTIGRSGLAGLLIGNTAEALLRQLKCSALAVKPSGFESPVV